jgi:hypothetical protein
MEENKSYHIISHNVKKVGAVTVISKLTSHGECFDQNELSDLIRDLNLSKESSELLASRLKKNYILSKERKGFAAILY